MVDIGGNVKSISQMEARSKDTARGPLLSGPASALFHHGGDGTTETYSFSRTAVDTDELLAL